jgi:hypothetical protein
MLARSIYGYLPLHVPYEGNTAHVYLHPFCERTYGRIIV